MSLVKAVALTAICCSLPSPAAAAERHQINLPAGRLGQAVAMLGRQARISIGISDPALALRQVPRVRGTLTVDQALQRLLRGVSARAVFVDAETVRIVPAPRAATRPRQRQIRVAAVPPRPAAQPPRAANRVGPEIIVTASRRALPLRSYPGSVAIVPGDDPLLTARLAGSEALVNRLPILSSTHLGPGRNKLFVRGISDSSFNGLAQATVGQYFGETRINYNTPDPDLRLHDVDRIEVLPGPQGTLYGAGSLGGIVRVVPNAPSLDGFAAYGSVGVSTTAHGDGGAEAAAMINAPIVGDRLALRVSAHAQSQGGYIDDTRRGLEDVNRVRVVGGRFILRSVPDDHWTVDVHGMGQKIRGEDAQFAERGQPPLTRRSDITQDFDNDYFMAGVNATREWEDYRFVASTGLVRHHLLERYDATWEGNPPAAYDLDTRVSLFSAEARLSRRTGETGWLLGGAFVSNSARQSRYVDFFNGNVDLRNRVTNDVVEGAIYGEGSVRVAPGITGTLGGRLSAVRLSSSGFLINPGFPLPEEPAAGSKTELRFLPTAAIAAETAPNLLVYGRYQQSYRAGGLVVAGSSFNRFDPDKIASLEAGIRYGVPGQGLFDASAAVAYTRWDDVQADILDIYAEHTTANIGDARIYTFDASVGWRPAPGLALEASAVVNDSKVGNVPARIGDDGSPPLPGVAAFNGRLAADYAFAGPGRMRLRFSSALRYVGRSYLGVGEFFRRAQGDWIDLSSVLRAEMGRHAFSLTVTNLLDTRANRFSYGSPFTLVQRDLTTPARPRTITLSWEVRY